MLKKRERELKVSVSDSWVYCLRMMKTRDVDKERNENN